MFGTFTLLGLFVCFLGGLWAAVTFSRNKDNMRQRMASELGWED
jgi:hypothetical protein